MKKSLYSVLFSEDDFRTYKVLYAGTYNRCLNYLNKHCYLPLKYYRVELSELRS